MKLLVFSLPGLAKFLLSGLLLATLLTSTATTVDAAQKTQHTSSPKQGSRKAAKRVPLTLVTLTEPRERAFTVKMPKGWKNQVAVVPVYDQKRPIVTATSPDKNTFLFMTDPQMPTFAEPSPEMPTDGPLANINPMMKAMTFQPAKQFFTSYLKQKFGKLPEFRMLGSAPNPRLEAFIRKKMAEEGMPANVTATLIAFDYRDNGKLIHCLINGQSTSLGPVWMANLSGVCTSGDPTQYNDLLFAIGDSYKPSAQWQAKQSQLSKQRHEAIMAMIQAGTVAMTRRHNANMAWIQNSAARHQQRMDALHAAGDARMAAWKAQQEESDNSQRRFLNYIKGEETVVSSSGSTYQVQSGSGTYFKNKNNNTYIGMDSHKELEDLRKAWGLNPSDYEQVKIKR